VTRHDAEQALSGGDSSAQEPPLPETREQTNGGLESVILDSSATFFPDRNAGS